MGAKKDGMKNVNVAVTYLKNRLKWLGIKVVDASTYPGTALRKNKYGDVAVVAGYIPGKACMFTVLFSFTKTGHRQKENNYTFVIDGEFTEDARQKVKIWGDMCLFPDIKRNSAGISQTLDWPCFKINDHTGYLKIINDKDKIDRGMNFYSDFLEKYGSLLKKRFTQDIFLWFVPEGSDVLNKIEKKSHVYNPDNYTQFNARVMEKFPKTFFARTQKP